MWARAVAAALFLLFGLGLENRAEGNITRSYGQLVGTDKFLEYRNVWEAYGKVPSCVEHGPFDVTHVCRNDANTQFVSFPMRTLTGGWYFHNTPPSTFMDLGWRERIAECVPILSPLTRPTGFGDNAIAPFIGNWFLLSGSVIDVSGVGENSKHGTLVIFRDEDYRSVQMFSDNT